MSLSTNQIALYPPGTTHRLLAIRSCLKLEASGMRRSRGPSANTIACAELGLPKGTKVADTLAALNSLIESIKNV